MLEIALFGKPEGPVTVMAEAVLGDTDHRVNRFPGGDPAAWLRSIKPDLLLSAGYPKLLPAEALTIPNVGAINVHPSLLPEYKGSYPVPWALYEGRTEVGITIHEMAIDFDAGAIIAQERLDVDPNDDVDFVYRGVLTLGRQTLAKALDTIDSERLIHGRAQLEDGSFRGVPWRELDRLAFDWTLPGEEIARRSRVFREYVNIPTPSGPVFIHHVETAAGNGGETGRMLRRRPDSVTVQTGHGAVKLSGLRRRKEPRGATDKPASVALGLRLPGHL